MTRYFYILVWCMAELLFTSAPPASAGNIEAVVSIVNGMELSSNDSHDLTHELDGTIVELGASRCEIKAGHCMIENVKPGAHVASVVLKNESKEFTDSFVGTNTGSVVRLSAGPSGKLLVFPQKINKLIYKIERTKGSHKEVDEDDLEDEEEMKTSQLGQALKIDLWVRYHDEREGGAHERQAFENELVGGKIKLGRSTCVITSNVCLFDKVRLGTNKIKLNIKDTAKVSYHLAPETRPLTIILDEWTHKPRIKEFIRDPYIMIDKSMLTAPQ